MSKKDEKVEIEKVEINKEESNNETTLLTKEMLEEIIKFNINTVVSKEFYNVSNDQNVETLNRLYKLFLETNNNVSNTSKHITEFNKKLTDTSYEINKNLTFHLKTIMSDIKKENNVTFKKIVLYLFDIIFKLIILYFFLQKVLIIL
jgi:2C-methyl-D-erythritol 2,4-cyclodiphosphate synthase